MDHAFAEFPNPDAVTFARILYRFIHLLDDLFDHDRERSAEDVALTFFGLLDHVSSNPFYQAHKNEILPILFSSAKAWAASERLRKSENVQEQLAAEVLKSQYQDVFFQIATLAGGIEFGHQWEAKYRTYTFG
jgi:hypothetical protein